jgi:hypothetical protein
MNDSNKISLMNPNTCKAPLVKEELYTVEDANHCFVYDMAKSRGGLYSIVVALNCLSHENCVL